MLDAGVNLANNITINTQGHGDRRNRHFNYQWRRIGDIQRHDYRQRSCRIGRPHWRPAGSRIQPNNVDNSYTFTGPINATFPSTAKNAANPNDNAIQIARR